MRRSRSVCSAEDTLPERGVVVVVVVVVVPSIPPSARSALPSSFILTPHLRHSRLLPNAEAATSSGCVGTEKLRLRSVLSPRDHLTPGCPLPLAHRWGPSTPRIAPAHAADTPALLLRSKKHPKTNKDIGPAVHRSKPPAALGIHLSLPPSAPSSTLHLLRLSTPPFCGAYAPASTPFSCHRQPTPRPPWTATNARSSAR